MRQHQHGGLFDRWPCHWQNLLFRLPLPSQSLPLQTLCGCQVFLDKRDFLLGEFVALRPGEQPPFVSLNLILRHASAIGIHLSKVNLPKGIALICRFAIPLHRFNFILRHAPAIGIHLSEVDLPEGIAFFCLGTHFGEGRRIPFARFFSWSLHLCGAAARE